MPAGYRTGQGRVHTPDGGREVPKLRVPLNEQKSLGTLDFHYGGVEVNHLFPLQDSNPGSLASRLGPSTAVPEAASRG